MRGNAGGEVYEREGNTNGTNIANEGAYYVRVIYNIRYVYTYAKRRMQHMGAMMPLRKRKGTTATCADSRRKQARCRGCAQTATSPPQLRVERIKTKENKQEFEEKRLNCFEIKK